MSFNASRIMHSNEGGLHLMVKTNESCPPPIAVYCATTFPSRYTANPRRPPSCDLNGRPRKLSRQIKPPCSLRITSLNDYFTRSRLSIWRTKA